MINKDTKGRIHSIETLGAVDGPGIRYTVFEQGCPLNCAFCHNPDTWSPQSGREVTAGEVIADAFKYRSYMRYSGGGITLTGGEPLLQPDFTRALLALSRERGIHTTVDTSGYAPLEEAIETVRDADLIMVSVKAATENEDDFFKVTGRKRNPARPFLRALADVGKPVWVRYVLVPGLTDDPEQLESLNAFLQTLPNVEKIEVLPFHKMGETKWGLLAIPYRLSQTPPPTEEQLKKAGLTLCLKPIR